MAPHPSRLVYRLRGLPSRIDTHTQAAQLLSWALDQPLTDIQVCSLATVTVGSWTGTTKIATIMFSEIPQIIQNFPHEDEWTICRPPLRDDLLLDSHFRGMTPLHDILPPHEHKHSCIAISGLASHPFGSWQPREGRKEFMWLRDELPRYHPTMRVWIYGYDTKMVNSTSFQSISDLSVALINHLEAPQFASPAAPQILVMAHSLGGIVFKEAISNLARGNERHTHILHQIRGAILFGVPNLGMDQSHFQSLVQHQPNRAIVEDLANGSPYLINLDKQFLGHISNHRLNVIWAYETQTSAIFKVNQEGKVIKSTERRILVSKESATSNLINQRTDRLIPINKDHSSIVKYVKDDMDCGKVLSKIGDLLESIAAPPLEMLGTTPELTASHLIEYEKIAAGHGPSRISALKGVRDEEIRILVASSFLISLLQVPELSHRHEGIEVRARHTFEWLFENEELSFTKWLISGVKPYWIQGKPGSGKSTLMKFLCDDPRTRGCIRHWKKSSEPIFAAFFFHHRGSVLQKSVDGLLRSILAQILKQQPRLMRVIISKDNELMDKLPTKEQMFRANLQNQVWKQRELWKMLCDILSQTSQELDIFLFFDAIDEYDGSLDVIKEFLSDLQQVSSLGCTNLKICFSSRSWDTFVQSFSDYPGLAIHDHTADDIREYCYQTLEMYEGVAGAIGPLVPEIVTTARGVFLWARLALRDLITAGNSTTDYEVFQRQLRSLPRELKEYYEEIVNRCQRSLRMKAYVLLETVTRSEEVLTLPQALLALACSDPPTFDACRNAIEREEVGTIDHKRAQRAQKVITNACGGLLEVKKSGRIWYVQLMHQTVREFVLGSKFKPLFLGSGAKHHHENGHSFLGKFYLVQRGMALTPTKNFMPFLNNVNKDSTNADTTSTQHFLPLMGDSYAEHVRYHLKQAEMTTGKNQLPFLKSFAPDILMDAMQVKGWKNPNFLHLPYAQFYFATSAGLLLCLEELITQSYLTVADREAALIQFLFLIGVGCYFERADSEESLRVLRLLHFEPESLLETVFFNQRHDLISEHPIVKLSPHLEEKRVTKKIATRHSIANLRAPFLRGLKQGPDTIVQIHHHLVRGLLQSEYIIVTGTISPFNRGVMICNPDFIQWIFQDPRHCAEPGIWPSLFVECAIRFWASKACDAGTYSFFLALAESTNIIIDKLSSAQNLVLTDTTGWPVARSNLLELGTHDEIEHCRKTDDLLAPKFCETFVMKLDILCSDVAKEKTCLIL